jgi:TRAP-type C4-dicarboxylate transport system permease small subunit
MTEDDHFPLRRILHAIDRGLEPCMMVTLCSVLVLSLSYSAIVRYFLPFPLLTRFSHTAEELAIFSFIWLLYSGAAYATREGAHFRVTAHFNVLPERWRRWRFLPGDIVWLAFNAFVVWQGMLLVQSALERTELSLAMQVPMEIVYTVIPLTFALTCFRLVQSYFRPPPERRGEQPPLA